MAGLGSTFNSTKMAQSWAHKRAWKFECGLPVTSQPFSLSPNPGPMMGIVSSSPTSLNGYNLCVGSPERMKCNLSKPSAP
eukprot:CAMPEP_0115335834 /NCGR_PEP_ID=MMETSP0270-20121206/88681_1 /TAXON_ID=71861 /ORGANISM="Scrippsiella trochoidea, Strain CCMP3099" /LENGTH=79 /DNA_ID=CAMNT_0002756961 /DNA_START=12 /DNA_END=248 /DNA_ORIENTATION=+